MTKRKKPAKSKFCHPGNKSIPIGKRKVEFVKWLMRQGCSESQAKLICYKKFYREENQ